MTGDLLYVCHANGTSLHCSVPLSLQNKVPAEEDYSILDTIEVYLAFGTVVLSIKQVASWNLVFTPAGTGWVLGRNVAPCDSRKNPGK